jgi:hypothetical protein
LQHDMGLSQLLTDEDEVAGSEPVHRFEPPMLTAREISVACALPALFFALLNALYLSDSILQILSTLVGTLLEVKKVEVVGFELGLTSRGIAFLTIALLWGTILWLSRSIILGLYSRPRRMSPPRRIKWLDEFVARLLPISPGRLAGLAKESENLIFAQYGVNTSLIWPRLVSVIPERYLSEIDRSNLFLHFFLNLSISSMVLALEILIAMVWLGHLPLGILGVVSLALYYAFYVAAVLVMGRRLLYVQSCFDLYRMDLLKQMRMPLPKTLEEEFVTWSIVQALLLFEADLDPSEIYYATADKSHKNDDGKTKEG